MGFIKVRCSAFQQALHLLEKFLITLKERSNFYEKQVKNFAKNFSLQKKKQGTLKIYCQSLKKQEQCYREEERGKVA